MGENDFVLATQLYQRLALTEDLNVPGSPQDLRNFAPLKICLNAELSEFEQIPGNSFSGQLFRVWLRTADKTRQQKPPPSLVFKFSTNPVALANEKQKLEKLHEFNCSPMTIPKVYSELCVMSENKGMLVMSDEITNSKVLCITTNPNPESTLTNVLRSLAMFHAANWDMPLSSPNQALFQPTESKRAEAARIFLAHVSDFQDDQQLAPLLSTQFLRLLQSFRQYFQPLCMYGVFSPEPSTLCHNMLLPSCVFSHQSGLESTEPSFTSTHFGEICFGSPGLDLAALICLSLDDETRRQMQTKLLEQYVETLTKHINPLISNPPTIDLIKANFCLGVLLLIPKMVQLYAHASKLPQNAKQNEMKRLETYLQRVVAVVSDMESPSESNQGETLSLLFESLVREITECFDPTLSFIPASLFSNAATWSDFRAVQIGYASHEHKTIFIETNRGMAVLKRPISPICELFASRFAEQMNIKTPHVILLHPRHPAFETIKRHLFSIQRTSTNSTVVPRIDEFFSGRNGIFVQEYILGGPSRSLLFVGLKGRALFCPGQVSNSVFDEIDEIGQLRLEEFGMITAVNLFLNNSSSLPFVTEEANPSNVLFNLTSNAIQEFTIVVDLAVNELHGRDLEGYKSLVSQILSSALEREQYWQPLLDFISECTGTLLHGNSHALYALRMGLVKGLTAIASLTPAGITALWNTVQQECVGMVAQTNALSFLHQMHTHVTELSSNLSLLRSLDRNPSISQIVQQRHRTLTQQYSDANIHTLHQQSKQQQLQQQDQTDTTATTPSPQTTPVISVSNSFQTPTNVGPSSSPLLGRKSPNDSIATKNDSSPKPSLERNQSALSALDIKPPKMRRTTTSGSIEVPSSINGLIKPVDAWHGLAPEIRELVCRGTELLKYNTGLSFKRQEPRLFSVTADGSKLEWVHLSDSQRKKPKSISFVNVLGIRRTHGKNGMLLSFELGDEGPLANQMIFIKFSNTKFSHTAAEQWASGFVHLSCVATGRPEEGIVIAVNHDDHRRLK